MRAAVASLMLSACAAWAQTPLDIRQFTSAQKVEWVQFSEYWHGNGKGTCLPMMEESIRAGRCTHFDFSADLTIGEDGKIKAVKALRNRIACEDKKVRGDLLQCFAQSLRDDQGLWRDGGFTTLRARIVRSAPL